MCSRYETPEDLESVHKALAYIYQVSPRAKAWRSNPDVRPTDPVLIAAQWGGVGMLGVGRWGWKNDELHINTKSETADTLTFWREGVNRRCVMPAKAWFEFQAVPGQKKKRRIRIAPEDGRLIFLLAIWRPVGEGEAEVSMLTRAAPPNIATFHERAVLPIGAADVTKWITSENSIRDWANSPALVPVVAVN